MDSGPTGHSSQIGVSGSIQPSCYSIRMAARSEFPNTIAVKQGAGRETTQQRP